MDFLKDDLAFDEELDFNENAQPTFRDRFARDPDFRKDVLKAEQDLMEDDPDYNKWLDEMSSSNAEDLANSVEGHWHG